VIENLKTLRIERLLQTLMPIAIMTLGWILLLIKKIIALINKWDNLIILGTLAE
jgi:hypothetical protein